MALSMGEKITAAQKQCGKETKPRTDENWCFFQPVFVISSIVCCNFALKGGIFWENITKYVLKIEVRRFLERAICLFNTLFSVVCREWLAMITRVVHSVFLSHHPSIHSFSCNFFVLHVLFVGWFIQEFDQKVLFS